MKAGVSIEARYISQTLLETTGRALMTRDAKTFTSVFHLPHELESFDGTVTLETREELEQLFHDMCDYFQRLGVTDLIRECISANFRSETQIEATHMSHLVRNGTRLTDPYPVFSVLRKIDGKWMISSGKYAVDSSSGSGRAINRHRIKDGTEKMPESAISKTKPAT